MGIVRDMTSASRKGQPTIRSMSSTTSGSGSGSGSGSRSGSYTSTGIGMESVVIQKTSNKSTQSVTVRSLDEWLTFVKSLEPIDVERELHSVKKIMGAHYSQGNYQAALESAAQLEEAVSATIGKENAVYASCLNNIALMNKMLGNNDHAMEKYIEALQLYAMTVGKRHSSYASILSNIGILYRSMADAASGMDRLQLVERSEEALVDALSIRVHLAPGKLMRNSKEALSVAMNLAMVHRLKDSKGVVKCEEDLRSVLEMTREAYGDNDSLTALILSNLGFVLKAIGSARYNDAKLVYSEALEIRSKTNGDSHPDTIVSMHNLAELCLAMGSKIDIEEGTLLQEQILVIMEKSRNLTVIDRDAPAVVAPVKSTSTNSATLMSGSPGSESDLDLLEAAQIKKKVFEPTVPLVTFATRKPKGKK